MSALSNSPHVNDPLDQLVSRLRATLSELGWDVALNQLAEQLPDASNRLAYVGQMTEDAAMKVLNIVYTAQPACQAAARDAAALAERLQSQSAEPALALGDARAALAADSEALRRQADVNRAQKGLLTDIMMAQDFQDLSGQVIKKVVLMISDTEHQLRQVLAQSEGQVATPRDTSKLEGAQVPDKAVAQEAVDDLLASMGF